MMVRFVTPETMTTGSESALILPHYRLSSSCGPQSLVSEEAQPRREYTALRGGASGSPPTASAAAGAHARAGWGGAEVAGEGRAWTGGRASGPGSSRPPFIWIPTELSFLP